MTALIFSVKKAPCGVTWSFTKLSYFSLLQYQQERPCVRD